MDKITVSFEKIEKIYKKLKKDKVKEVSFEFIIGSLFPNIYQNIKNELRRQYTLGYTEGAKTNEKQD